MNFYRVGELLINERSLEKTVIDWDLLIIEDAFDEDMSLLMDFGETIEGR